MRTCRNVLVSGTAATRRFIRQWTDTVHVPRRNTFTSSEAFYSVLFHELTHSTGHEGRLNRKTLTDGTPFGSDLFTRGVGCRNGRRISCARWQE